MQIIPLLHLNPQNLMDPQSLQPFDRQRRRQVRDQHVMPTEGVEDMLGNGALALPLEGMLDEVLPQEGAACFLEAAVRVGVVGGGEAAEVGGFGEGDGVGGDGGHDCDVSIDQWDHRFRQNREGVREKGAGSDLDGDGAQR